MGKEKNSAILTIFGNDGTIEPWGQRQQGQEACILAIVPRCPLPHWMNYLSLYANIADNPGDYESDVGGEDDSLDVVALDGFETYTWAGQTRVRATSLVEGGLRGAGFLTITRGDEDAELVRCLVSIPKELKKCCNRI